MSILVSEQVEIVERTINLQENGGSCCEPLRIIFILLKFPLLSDVFAERRLGGSNGRIQCTFEYLFNGGKTV